MSSTKKYKAGFSLIEMMAVMAVLVVLGGLFYTTFVMNYQGLDFELTRAGLWTEADTITEDMTYYGRGAKEILFNGPQQVTFVYPDSSKNVSYTITSTGATGAQLARVGPSGNSPYVLSSHLIYANTSFVLDASNTLLVDMALTNKPLFGTCQISTSFRVLNREPTGVQGA